MRKFPKVEEQKSLQSFTISDSYDFCSVLSGLYLLTPYLIITEGMPQLHQMKPYVLPKLLTFFICNQTAKNQESDAKP